MRFSLYGALLLSGGLFVTGCDEPLQPVNPVPSDCGYNLPVVTFSDPERCEPQLITVDRLDLISIASGQPIPPLPADCTAEGNTRIVELPGTSSSTFRLHVYRATPVALTLSVYGEVDCGEVVPLRQCEKILSVATPLEVNTQGGTYRRYFVRLSYSIEQSAGLEKTNYVGLAAYEDEVPGSAGRIRYATTPEGNNGGDNEPDSVLPFSCDGRSFQRIVLGGCTQTKEDIQNWIKLLGLEVEEEYYGPFGNVAVLTVPPGMDPNTTGGSAAEVRAKANGGDGTAEPDYAINLFTPRKPALTFGRVPQVADVPQLIRGDISLSYLENQLAPFEPIKKVDEARAPTVVSVIDSGVESDGPNRAVFNSTVYRGPLESEYVRVGKLGFDFISKDFSPDDVTPHGTYVAATVIGKYKQKSPLSLVNFKIFGREGVASYFGALVAVYESVTVRSQLINMSWGIEQAVAPKLLECAITTAAAEGVIMITSAGNDSLNLAKEPQWPAAFSPRFPDNLVTVGSYWYKRSLQNPSPQKVALLDFSNLGDPFVTLAGYMTAPVPEYQDGTIIYPIGTSFSAPIVTGTLADALAMQPGGDLSLIQARYQTADSLKGEVLNRFFLPADRRNPQP